MPHMDIIDRLPEYVNGSLDEREAALVRAHLIGCVECTAELLSWELIRDAYQSETAAAPVPSFALLDSVWARLDALPAQPDSERRSGGVWVRHLWGVLRGQAQLISPGIWIGSFAMMMLAVIVIFVARNSQASPAILAFFAPLIAATGVAFIYGPESDPAMELAASTPTSPRTILSCRLILVFGYDFLLIFATTIALAILSHVNPWVQVAAWLGPMLVLTAMSLALSMIASAVAAVSGTLGLLILHTLENTRLIQSFPVPGAPLHVLWSSGPTMVVLSGALIVIAYALVPQKKHQESR